MREILKTTPEENLRMIEETCRFFKEHGKTVIFDAEHFLMVTRPVRILLWRCCVQRNVAAHAFSRYVIPTAA